MNPVSLEQTPAILLVFVVCVYADIHFTVCLFCLDLQHFQDIFGQKKGILLSPPWHTWPKFASSHPRNVQGSPFANLNTGIDCISMALLP